MKKVIILGAGESGVGAAILAKKLGADVWVSDSKSISDKYKQVLVEEGIAFEENQHTFEKFFDADVVIKSPGIPEKAEAIQYLRRNKVSIVSEVEFAAHYTDAKLIAITGSNGKTTVTSLVYHLLKEAGYDVGLGGNIGQSFALQVARHPHALYVLEISSFQLDDVDIFHPNVAVLTNITEDHLDRYEYKLEKYASAKFRIGANQTEEDLFIYNAEDPVTLTEMEKHPLGAEMVAFGLQKSAGRKAWIEGNELVIVVEEEERYDFGTMQLVGKHNAANTLAAILAVRAIGMKPEEIAKHLPSFAPIEHRIERVAIVQEVEYINDSKATNTDSTWYALECMEKPVIWIAGGVDKGNDYGAILPLAKEKVKALIVLGPYKDKLIDNFTGLVPKVVHVMSMEEAVKTASALAVAGDCVLLSPCCASFDLFQNYEDRGRKFKAAVGSLMS